jgi:hypothetical protein
MKELANLSKRVEKLEYYTSFNNVEALALADKTQYEDGTEKEKYGIVGENFQNFNVADYKNQDFAVALENGFMVPALRHEVFGLKNIATNTTKRNKKTISLEYTETPAIVQNVASNKAVSVQPFLFGQFNGVVELTPETDYWFAETLKPEIISVPERIIEHHHVIREIIKEPPAPVTIVNNYYSTNVVNQIITSPGDDTTEPNPDDKGNTDPTASQPVVVGSGGGDTSTTTNPIYPPAGPPSENVVNTIINNEERNRKDQEEDLWWGPDFIFLNGAAIGGISFTFGVSGTSIWYPTTSSADTVYIEPDSIQPPDSINPTLTEPISLGGGGGSSLQNPELVMDESGVGGNAREYMAYDFDEK